MTPAVRSWFPPTTALALGVLLLFHPQGGDRICILVDITWPVTLLVGASSLFVLHDAGPVGAIGLACFATAAVLVARTGTRSVPAPAEVMGGVTA
jgi:hypothetical protein